jgi:hypothetical protein
MLLTLTKWSECLVLERLLFTARRVVGIFIICLHQCPPWSVWFLDVAIALPRLVGISRYRSWPHYTFLQFSLTHIPFLIPAHAIISVFPILCFFTGIRACISWVVPAVRVGCRLALCSCRCLLHPCLRISACLQWRVKYTAIQFNSNQIITMQRTCYWLD